MPGPIQVRRIRLRDKPAMIGRLDDPHKCTHEWVPNQWDASEAYCHHCGSFADIVFPSTEQ